MCSKNTKATRNWRVVYPSSHLSNSRPSRSVILVNTSIDINNWSHIHIPNTRDVVTVQVSSLHGILIIFDIYNDCLNADTIDLLGTFLTSSRHSAPSPGPNYMLWCGDFNYHHPMWDEEHNSHLFTAGALRDSDGLLALVTKHNMVMLLPKDILTLEPWPPKTGCTPTTSLAVPTWRTR